MTNDWLNPYLAMDKNQLLNQVDPKTLNDIRNAMGDQAFIDQWKLTREDYMRVLDGDQPQPAPRQPEPEPLAQSDVINSYPHQQPQPQQPPRDLTIVDNHAPVHHVRPAPVPVYQPQPARHVVHAPVRHVGPVTTTSYGYPAYTSTVRRTSPVSTRVIGAPAPVYSSGIRRSYVSHTSPVRVSPVRSYVGGYGASVVRRY